MIIEPNLLKNKPRRGDINKQEENNYTDQINIFHELINLNQFEIVSCPRHS